MLVTEELAVPRQVLDDLKAFHAEMSDYFVSHDLPTVDLIFPTIYGNYMCDRNERATLKKRLTELGLPNYGFHLFRHTHASLMLNAGANWKELQIRMGISRLKRQWILMLNWHRKRRQKQLKSISKKLQN
mgnify:CR=1 FL=1